MKSAEGTIGVTPVSTFLNCPPMGFCWNASAHRTREAINPISKGNFIVVIIVCFGVSGRYPQSKGPNVAESRLSAFSTTRDYANKKTG